MPRVNGNVTTTVTDPQATKSSILRTTSLTRSYSGVVVVNGVSIAIQPGTITGLIGPNGAGKSTTLAMLAGTTEPTSGRVFYQSKDITSMRAFERARLGLVRTFQLSSEFKRMTVLENLMSAVPGHPGDTLFGSLFARRRARRFEVPALARAGELLHQFGLSAKADEYAGSLSGGQRRLVEIMRAIMAGPRLLLLDEPMAGVHPRLAIEIGEHLVALRDAGMTILMVEHELTIVDQFCDPVIVLAEGEVLAEGTMAELRQRPDVVDAYLIG